MFLYVVIVWRYGYDSSQGDVLGYYRTEDDARNQGMRACADHEYAHFNVYKCVF